LYFRGGGGVKPQPPPLGTPLNKANGLAQQKEIYSAVGTH
jgi:hypothetical protein